MSDRIEVGGVDAPLDKPKINDMRFVLMLGDLDDPSMPDSDKLATIARLTRYLFGDERDAVMDAIAEAEGGMLAPDAFSRWLGEYLAEAGAKN